MNEQEKLNYVLTRFKAYLLERVYTAQNYTSEAYSGKPYRSVDEKVLDILLALIDFEVEANLEDSIHWLSPEWEQTQVALWEKSRKVEEG